MTIFANPVARNTARTWFWKRRGAALTTSAAIASESAAATRGGSANQFQYQPTRYDEGDGS